jgi:RHS repeat-associated protein
LYQAQLCGANGTFYNSQTDVVKQNSQQNDEFGTAGQEGNPSVGVAPEGTILRASASEETRRPASAGAWRTYHPARGGGPGPNARDDSEEVYSPREAVMAYSAREAAITGPASPAGAEATYYYWDHLGTVRMTAGGNPTAETVERHDYEPYGLEMGPAPNSSGNTHQFTGHERDALGGVPSAAIDYMHFRYYGPNMGRFMKPDSIMGNLGNPQSWNLYSYVVGNPVNRNDPTGHMSEVFLKEISGHSDFEQGPTEGATPPPASKEQQQVQNLNAQTGAASEESTQDPVPPPPKPKKDEQTEEEKKNGVEILKSLMSTGLKVIVEGVKALAKKSIPNPTDPLVKATEGAEEITRVVALEKVRKLFTARTNANEADPILWDRDKAMQEAKDSPWSAALKAKYLADHPEVTSWPEKVPE